MTGPARPSIWDRPERSGRGPAPEHSRTRLADAGIALADAGGLTAVTMRSVAAALDAGPASLYRYVATRGELVELMVDRAQGEIGSDDLGTGPWAADLLLLAQRSRAVYLRHPWLLDALDSGSPPGPAAVDYLEAALTVLADVDVSAGTKLEAVALLSGTVRVLARMEVGQGAAGQTLQKWQQATHDGLSAGSATGRHPRLAAALAAAAVADATEGSVFDRSISRLITALLGPG